MEMKKYQTPEMEVIDLKFQGILCGSPTESEQPGQGGEGGDAGMD